MDSSVIGVLGKGRWGSSLICGLRHLNFTVAAAGRADFSRISRFKSWVGRCSVLCLAVQDDQLGPVISRLESLSLAGKTILIHSGTQPLTLLSTLAEKGAVIGKFHALQAFTQASDQPPPPGTPFAFEGDIHSLVHPWVQGWKGLLHEVRGEEWARYHLAAVTSANFLAFLIRGGAEILAPLAGDRAGALTWLAPLVRHSVEAALDPENQKPYSGPAIRGDTQVMARQKELLALWAPHLLPLYEEASDALQRLDKDQSTKP